MKKTLRLAPILLLFIMGFVPVLHAQKSAFVDTEYILSNIPEYNDAQNELDKLSNQWQKEINQKHEALVSLINKYQSEAVLLPADLKKSRQEEIQKKQQEISTLQQKYFGPNGELFKKRKELVSPIQEKIYNAIQTVAQNRNIDFVYDKSGSASLLYGNPKYDISDAVLDELAKVMQVATPAAAQR
ncbi:MAG: OmpH family outer membrane protein [Bacteroidales bacterium]|nr:OmpH family outer membrane protein [Bacteroidales bacterium]